MIRKIVSVSVCAGILAFSGCSTARKISIRPGKGGVIAIPHADASRTKAQDIMSDVCEGKKPRVLEEKESVAGNVLERTAQSEKDEASSDKHRSREEAYSVKNEWRITFECRE